MLNFNQSLSRSMQQFTDIVMGSLSEILKGEFRVIEGNTTDDVAKLLDTLSGIDVWHINKLKGIRGLASRIQTTDRNWHTFTVRKTRDSGATTEFEKRKLAIEKGYLYPFFTMQAYVTQKDALIAFAVARTVDVIEMIDKGFCKTNKTRKEQIGQASFYIVDWYEMKERGYEIYIREY